MAEMSAFGKQLLKTLGVENLFEHTALSLGGNGIRLEKTAEGWNLCVKAERMLGRASMLMERYADEKPGFVVEEKPVYEDLGVMVDCSRNAVLNPDSAERLLRILSRMGFTTLQLYIEDIVELDGYPYFGYGRGRYTRQELRRLDDYAASVGIELIPAVQTLAHLGCALKWDALAPLKDVDDILLVDDENTYALIEETFKTMRQCLRTRRINIGMDEAHMLGLGKYRQLHGIVNRTELMLRHFARVHELANRYDFAPMMWSDMFFRLANGGEYYVQDGKMDASVAEKLPKDTTLLYWDYYTKDQHMYDRMLDQHMAITPNTAFACGAWRWTGYSPCNQFSMSIAGAAHASCQSHGVRQVLVTLWGDHGAECSTFAVLPCMQQWAELCWQGDDRDLERRFQLCTGGRLADFLLLDEPVFMPGNPAPGKCGVNPSRTIVHEDVLTPLFSHAIDLEGYVAHLTDVLKRMQEARQQEPAWATLFDEHAALVDLMIRKCRVQLMLRPAWEQKDHQALTQVCDELLPRLYEAVDALIAGLHAQWLSENHAAGLDVLDLRLGGLKQRILTAQSRIRAYLNGQIATVEELDVQLLPFAPEKGSHVYTPMWQRIASPCVMARD